MSISSVPPVGITRWVTRRKAQVVTAIRAGLLTIEGACHRYQLSRDEIESWEKLLDLHGVAGLRTTKAQDYRMGRRRTKKSLATQKRSKNNKTKIAVAAETR